jgi:stage III sporulation protein AB
MNVKLIGAVCVLVGCGSCGFFMAMQYNKHILMLRNLVTSLEYMECELQYRSTPLPLLCRQTADHVNGRIKEVFLMLADELDAQVSPNVKRCMSSVLDRLGIHSGNLNGVLETLGGSLGAFDLPGQLRALENTKLECREMLGKMLEGKESRVRSYQTLGLCAGAALVILFI